MLDCQILLRLLLHVIRIMNQNLIVAAVMKECNIVAQTDHVDVSNFMCPIILVKVFLKEI